MDYLAKSLADAAQNRHPIPALLPQPDRLIAKVAQGGFGEALIRCLELLQTYQVRLGKRDGRQVEVLEGLDAGDAVVVEQSYLIKADIEKAGAAHEH